jgi:hypothetical protein
MKNYTSAIIAALLVSVFTGCSKHSPAAVTPKVTDLGVVEISNGTPIRRDLGDGKACVITPTVITYTNSSARFVRMRMVIEQPDSSGVVQTQKCPMIQSIAGETAEWRVGDIDIRLKTEVKP